MVLVGWLMRSPVHPELCLNQPAPFQPYFQKIERSLWSCELDSMQSEPPRPRLQLSAESMVLDCSNIASIQEHWQGWHCRWMDGQGAEVLARGQQACFFPQRMRLETGPVQLNRLPLPTSATPSVKIVPLEVHCAQCLLDISDSPLLPATGYSPGNASAHSGSEPHPLPHCP